MRAGATLVCLLAAGGMAAAGPPAAPAGQSPTAAATAAAAGAPTGTIDPLPASETRLANGLQLLVHEDHSSPVVAVDVWYHVGSKDERPGRTGFAHLFEHMMFKGSAHVGDDQHFRYVQEAGGTCNATTNTDRTNYFETLPSAFLERALWLEADRMGFLLPPLTQEKLDNQRDVVRNERRQNYENRPYGGAQKVLHENIFPPSHPYHWLTIGEHADLEAATLEDIKEFFGIFYSPSNATLVVAGDVDPAQVRKLVDKYFGPLPPGPPVLRKPAPPLPRLEQVKRVRITDRVALERLYVVWPSAALFKPGDADLDLLADVLGTKSGRLFRRLVYQDRTAQSVEVDQASALLASTFRIVITLKPGKTAADALPALDEELDKIRKEGVTPRELERAQNRREEVLLRGLMGVHGRADQLARYAVFAGDPGYLPRDLQRYRAATVATLRAAFAALGPGRLELVVAPAPKSESK